MFRASFQLLRSVSWLAATRSGMARGQVVLIHDRLAITALHVVRAGGTAVGRWDGLWNTKTVLTDEAQDLAVVVLEERLQTGTLGFEAPTVFPSISAIPAAWGDDVAVMGNFERMHSGETETQSHQMVTRGIISYLRANPLRWAVHGAFAEPGFSGGPVFRANGELVGIVTSVTSTASLTDAAVPMAFPLMSPLFQHRQRISQLIAEYSTQTR